MDKQKTKEKVIGRILDYHKVFNSVEGKRVLFDMMTRHYVLKSSIDQNHHVTAYNEGQRNVVLSIMAELEVDPTKIAEAIDNQPKEQDLGPDIFFNAYEEGKK